MKNAARKLSALLVTVGFGIAAFQYLRYEQRVELARFQSGFTEGLQLGALQERRKLIGDMDCFGVVKAKDGTQALLCGVPIENGAVARGSDLEQ